MCMNVGMHICSVLITKHNNEDAWARHPVWEGECHQRGCIHVCPRGICSPARRPPQLFSWCFQSFALVWGDFEERYYKLLQSTCHEFYFALSFIELYCVLNDCTSPSRLRHFWASGLLLWQQWDSRRTPGGLGGEGRAWPPACTCFDRTACF